MAKRLTKTNPLYWIVALVLIVVIAVVYVGARMYVLPPLYALLYALAGVSGWYIYGLIVVGCLATMWLIVSRLDR
jgi:hypothetical protein